MLKYARAWFITAFVLVLASSVLLLMAIVGKGWLVGSAFQDLSLRLGLFEMCNDGLLTMLIREKQPDIVNQFDLIEQQSIFRLGKESCLLWSNMRPEVFFILYRFSSTHLTAATVLLTGSIVISIGVAIILICVDRWWLAMSDVWRLIGHIVYIIWVLCGIIGLIIGISCFSRIKTAFESLSAFSAKDGSDLVLGYSCYLAGISSLCCTLSVGAYGRGIILFSKPMTLDDDSYEDEMNDKVDSELQTNRFQPTRRLESQFSQDTCDLRIDRHRPPLPPLGRMRYGGKEIYQPLCRTGTGLGNGESCFEGYGHTISRASTDRRDSITSLAI
eukprot:GHVL01005119.1.p1 GENE.GHVL01005119.1~~GHVL01005119.1.p1  ORF type:complete len:330 (+),score=42.83 GHVL01005119.1:82-1071(+)